MFAAKGFELMPCFSRALAGQAASTIYANIPSHGSVRGGAFVFHPRGNVGSIRPNPVHPGSRPHLRRPISQARAHLILVGSCDDHRREGVLHVNPIGSPSCGALHRRVAKIRAVVISTASLRQAGMSQAQPNRHNPQASVALADGITSSSLFCLRAKRAGRSVAVNQNVPTSSS